MTWTWDETALSTSALQQVRATIGDTNTSDQLLSNEHITWRLSAVSDAVVSASVQCIRDIIAKLSRDYDRSNVGISGSRSQKIQHYKDLLEEIKNQSYTLASMSVGGLSTSQASAIRSNTDSRNTLFRRAMDSNNTVDSTTSEDVGND